MKKKLLSIVFIIAMMVLMTTTAFAGSEIKVAIDGEYVKFDVKPQAVNGRTMVPLRAIFEALGADVDWDNDSQTVIAIKDDIKVTATIGNTKMYVNDSGKTMDVAPMAIDGRTLVPVRFIAEAYNCDVEWDGDNNIVDITTRKPYVIRKLADAKLDNLDFATMDEEDNIYYIDSDNNCIYKMDIKTGEKTKLIDTQNFSYNEIGIDEDFGREIECEYTSFVPIQVFYDRENDRLLLNGYYENLVETGKMPSVGEQYQFIYDIANGNCDVITSNPYSDFDRRFMTIKAALNDKYLVMCNAKSPQTELFWKLNTQNDLKEGMGVEERYGINFWCLKYGNELFMLEQGSYSGKIYNYDFGTCDLEPLSDPLYFDALGTKDDCYYFWNNDGMVFKISVRNLKVSILDINTLSENVEIADMGNMRNIDSKFFVIDDNTIIFYDTEMQAFRILEKNI